jgi:hypothetical protein
MGIKQSRINHQLAARSLHDGSHYQICQEPHVLKVEASQEISIVEFRNTIAIRIK